MVIGYVGTERCDIVYYMARIAIETGKKTLIVDNSMKGDLYRALTNGTGKRKDTSYGAVVRDCDVTNVECDAYDSTFIYHGQAKVDKTDLPYDVNVDHLFVAAEGNQIEIQDTKDALDATGFIGAPCTFILREAVNEKIVPQTMATLIGLADMDCVVIPLAESDRAKYDALLNGGTQKCNGVSSDMKYLLTDFMRDVLEIPEKNTKKMFSRL